MKKAHLLLITFLVSVMANAQMVLEYETPTAGDSIALPLNGTVDVTVDWGDGTTEDFTEAQNQWHVYATSGTKTVTIKGTLTHFGNSQVETANKHLIEVSSWDNLGLLSLHNAFYKAENLTKVPTNLPHTITDLGYVFHLATKFNFDIGEWNTSNVTNMKGTFYKARSFNQDIGNWITDSITSMEVMFLEASKFNQDISKWNTSNVTTMNHMFNQAHRFNQPIGAWNTSNVIDMKGVFHNAKSFNQDIGSWDVAKVMDMSFMFYSSPFNKDISNWKTSNVTNMSQMFGDAKSFDQDISAWNLEHVTEITYMFYSATSFNQPIENWNLSKITSLKGIFKDASAFNQPLGNWDISRITTMENFFVNSGLCTENYDATLNSWASQTVQEGIVFDGGDSKYSEASETARATLAEKWTITDGGLGTTEADKCSPVLSTENLSTSSDLDIYPNPVQDILQVKATSLSHFSIYSLTGKLIEEASVQSSNIEVDLNEVPSGIYILQTESQAGIQTQRFTKQ